MRISKEALLLPIAGLPRSLINRAIRGVYEALRSAIRGELTLKGVTVSLDMNSWGDESYGKSIRASLVGCWFIREYGEALYGNLNLEGTLILDGEEAIYEYPCMKENSLSLSLSATTLISFLECLAYIGLRRDVDSLLLSLSYTIGEYWNQLEGLGEVERDNLIEAYAHSGEDVYSRLEHILIQPNRCLQLDWEGISSPSGSLTYDEEGIPLLDGIPAGKEDILRSLEGGR
jgi:hypothetical protein